MFHIYEGFHLVETYHKMRHQRKYNPDTKRAIKIALVALVTLVLWNMPSEWYGIQNLTVIQQRIIAIFAFATLMWILEIVSSWATSVAIIVLMLLFCTDSGVLPMVNEEEVGKLLSYKGVMATFADPVIMLFWLSLLRKQASMLSWPRCCCVHSALVVRWFSWASCLSPDCSQCSYPTRLPLP